MTTEQQEFVGRIAAHLGIDPPPIQEVSEREMRAESGAGSSTVLKGFTPYAADRIFIRRGQSAAGWRWIVAHELMHVAQHARYSRTWNWKRAYVTEYRRVGYLRNKFEREAEQFAAEASG